MSDEFPTLPDILNDNAGVVGAAAGYAVNRSVQATNKNLESLKQELSSMQRELAKTRQQEESEQKRREDVFQISSKLDELTMMPRTPEALLSIEQVAKAFEALNLTSASFRNLPDKEFVNATKLRIQSALRDYRDSVSSETLGLLHSLKQWHRLSAAAEELIQVDRRITENTGLLSEARTKDANAEQAYSARGLSCFLSEPRLAIAFGATLTIGLLGVGLLFWAISIGDVGLGLLALIALGIAAAPLGFCLQEFSKITAKLSTQFSETRQSLQTLERRLDSDQRTRKRLQAEIFQLDALPIELCDLLANSKASTRERQTKVGEVSAYARSLREQLKIPEHLLDSRR